MQDLKADFLQYSESGSLDSLDLIFGQHPELWTGLKSGICLDHRSPFFQDFLILLISNKTTKKYIVNPKQGILFLGIPSLSAEHESGTVQILKYILFVNIATTNPNPLPNFF